MFVGLLLAFCLVPVPTAGLPWVVARPFAPPACARCAGHRGVTLSIPPGTSVTVISPGTVTFVGQVAHRPFVTVRVAPGTLVTYGDLSGPYPVKGQVLGPGEPVGVSTGLVYVGVRRGGVPVDPRVALGSPRARLSVPAALRCPVGPPGPSR